jgi:cell division protein FtsW (lipid II flippase)
MNLGILLITGVPLPLISSGGSSILINFIALGIAHSVYLSSIDDEVKSISLRENFGL